MKTRFRSGGIGEPEIIYMDLYPNRWAFTIKIQDSGNTG
jgi:hypothetical protein